MAIYVIGDIQGCFDDLQRLLEHIHFNKVRDTLWFAGDLVNRGPKSLETLRFIKSLGDSAVSVLGNHDLHLLCLAYGYAPHRSKDTLQSILKAPDKIDLLEWLQHRPLFHHTAQASLLHAGLPPQWTIETAKQYAKEVEQVLRGSSYLKFFATLYGNLPYRWDEHFNKTDRLRYIVNCFTRLRFCDEEGRLDFKYNGKVGSQPAYLKPWFSLKNRKSRDHTLIFGHWSALGYYHGNNCYAIDTGCLWGQQLTALKLGARPKRISINCEGYHKP